MKADCIKIKNDSGQDVWALRIDDFIYTVSDKDYENLTKHPKLPPVQFIHICTAINNNGVV